MKRRLNIGASKTYIPGFVNVDYSHKAEISIDLGVSPIPFDDDEFSLVFSYHTLEHVENYLFALGEIHRVLRHGGWFLLGVPYALHPRNIANPYHHQRFNEYSFSFFDPSKLKGSAEESNDIIFKEVFHRTHEDTTGQVAKIDFVLIALKSLEKRYLLPTKGAMMDTFDDCLSKRVPYEAQP